MIQPQLISTKSVATRSRKNIFNNNNNINDSVNSSNLITNRSGLDGSIDKSRSRSKSKLGDLLKSSRDKKH
jgi:hypothetical protein